MFASSKISFSFSSSSALLVLLLSLSLLLPAAQAYPAYAYVDARSDFNVPVVYRSPSHSVMRNCFFSPVQCMMPPVQTLRFNRFDKRFN